jgi:TPR repeat protein
VAKAEELFARARRFDNEQQTALALPLYADASRQGMAAASLRLMEIFTTGTQDVTRNYLAAVEFKRLAVQQGITLEYPPRRDKVR